jgi:N-acetylmuramoyl-L-alanine amidase
MPINHTVSQGDSVISLSEVHGLFAVTIWNDQGNAGLRQKRTDMNVLMPGDVVVIPDKRPRLEKRPTGQTHRFRRKGIPAIFRFQFNYDGAEVL